MTESPLCATCNHRLSQHYHGDTVTPEVQRCVGLDLNDKTMKHEWCLCTLFVPIPLKENEDGQED